MNALVLGGTGFLGRYIIKELLKKQYSVTVLTRNPDKRNLFLEPVAFEIGDLLEFNTIDFSKYTHIINCSGELKDEGLMYALHVECINGILLKIKETNPNVHWIHISSVGVYGKVRSGIITEECTFTPVGIYEVTKAKGEQLVKQFCTINKINYTIIRPSNVFGIGMPNQSLAQLISMIRKRLFFYLGKKNDPIMMNYVAVEDVAHLVSLCMVNPQARNREYIISDELSLKAFVQVICDELHLKNNFFHIPESLSRLLAMSSKVIPNSPLTDARIDALTMRVKYSRERAETELGYTPKLGATLALKSYLADLTGL